MSQNTRDTKLLYSENPKTISYLGLERYQDVIDRHKTPRQNYHS